MSGQKGLHDKHRERMREKYVKGGLENLPDHEVLEMLLYKCKKRGNTNDTAHLLLNRFGSFSGVLDADYDELMSVDGVGAVSATFITMIPKILRRYALDKEKHTGTVYNTEEKIGDYLVNHFIGATREHVELLMFDASMRMVDHVTLHNGAVNSSDINAEKVAEYVFSRKVSSFILAHNHPGGSTEPSDEDIFITLKIRSAFEELGREMLEHYVVAEGKYRGILAAQKELY